MNRQLGFICAIGFVALLMGACNKEDKHSDLEFMTHDVDSLARFVNLSRVVIDMRVPVTLGVYRRGVSSRMTDGMGPTDYYLIATFKVMSIDTAGQAKINTVTLPLPKKSPWYKDWLSTPVKAHIFGNDTLMKPPVYSADIFSRASYWDGFFIVQNDSTVYLDMTTR